MEQTEQQINIPQIRVWNDYGRVWGLFGEYPLYDLKLDEKWDWRGPKLKNICFGPFIDFNKIKDLKIMRSIDDFLVVCDGKRKVVTIYDQIALDNSPRKINWFDPDDKQQPIIFEPRLTLFATAKTIYETKERKSKQTAIENMCLNIVHDMGFDDTSFKTRNRFFKPLTRDVKSGRILKSAILADSAFLIKTGKTFYSYYKIYSADMTFEVVRFNGEEVQYRYTLRNTKDLITHLKQDREKRNNYIKWQYAR